MTSKEKARRECDYWVSVMEDPDTPEDVKCMAEAKANRAYNRFLDIISFGNPTVDEFFND
jgi:hypothetical protein